MKKEKSFKEVLAEIEDPKNIGQGSWALPPNATPAEKVKYNLCEEILGYQEDNDLTDEDLAWKMHLTIPQTEDILFCRISKFSLEMLINAASQLFSSNRVKIVVSGQESNAYV